MQVLNIDWMLTYSNLSQIDEVSGGYVEKEMATHSSTLAWKIRGPRSMVGYSPWGC